MKKCKQCGEQRNHDNPLISLCRECVYNKSLKNKKQTRIRQVSKTNKNTPARFSEAIKEKILERDVHCILCEKQISSFHHVYFGSDSNRTSTRNDLDQWVWLCELHHHEIHHWIDGKGKVYRGKCIVYLKELKW